MFLKCQSFDFKAVALRELDYALSAWATVGCGVFGAGSGFGVGWRTVVWSLFFGAFLLVLAKLLFWRGDWALDYHSMAFRHFPIS